VKPWSTANFRKLFAGVRSHLVHLVRRRRVLDELKDLVLEDDLAAGDGEILADLEGRRVGLADLEEVARLLHVGDELAHALNEVLAVGGERLAHDLGIGHGEVRRREGARELAEIEVRLLARVIVEALRLLQHVLGPMGSEQIRLLPEIKVGVRRPLGVLEAVVGRLGLDDRLDLLA
jgi:hypothetical protein